MLLLAIPPAYGDNFALVVGISQYSKLPHPLWLRYADTDAAEFARFLATPQGGSIPAANVQLLINEQATTRAVRKAFKALLQTPGKTDTVYILISGHGTEDASGAYILTYESDPGDLGASALPMAELRSLVEKELSTAGHVIFLADVCHAAMIAGQKTTALGAVVEKIGESPGDMLGLMASRPKELSLEGPEFGGGHGAFTWAVLQGLAGKADTDHDGFVTSGELIDYVSTQVSKITGNRQHPRDFGNMDSGTRLSDVSQRLPTVQ